MESFWKRFLFLSGVAFFFAGCESDRSAPQSVVVPSSEAASIAEPPTFIPADPPTKGVSLAPNLYVDGDVLGATWLEVIEDGHRLQHALFVEGKWTDATTVAKGDNFVANWADVPSAIRGGDGAIYASWLEKVEGGPYAYGIQLARSVDAKTWKPLGSPHDDSATEHGFVSMIASDNGAEMVWLDGRQMAQKPAGPMTLRSVLLTETIGDSRLVDDRVCDCCGTSMARSKQGVVVAYRDRSAEEHRDVALVTKTENTWIPKKSLKRDAWTIQGCPVNGPMVSANDEQVAVAWFTGADQTTRVRMSISKNGDSYSEPLTVSQGSTLGRVDVTWLSQDEAFVLYLDLGLEDENAIIRGRRVKNARLGNVLDLATTTSGRASGFPKVEFVDGSLIMIWTETFPDKTTKIRGQKVVLPKQNTIERVQEKDPARDRTEKIGPAVGWSMPRYAAENMSGKSVRVKNPEGPTLINFWATWCKPCRNEMPALDSLLKRFPKTKLYAVSVDEPSMIGDLRIEAKKFDFELLHDSRNLAAGVFGVSSLPSTFLFVDDKLVWLHHGEITDMDALEKILATHNP